MSMDLNPSELRVLGCLIEKQRTTPDAYPLSLNALRLACNQSTNRDPIVDYDDGVLRDALHRLERRGYTRLASGAGSRAPKYRHLLDQALPMGEDERALLCVLMLRGAQTPGELKQRAERQHPFGELDEVHRTLARLIERGLVRRLERRPGQKEERYLQLLGEGAGGSGLDGSPTTASPRIDSPTASLPSAAGLGATTSPVYAGVSPTGDRPAAPPARDLLEERVARLEREVADLREQVAGP
jgi:uncharacterized protein YceH (UPF0502 family)